jgi:hypothetical protein
MMPRLWALLSLFLVLPMVAAGPATSMDRLLAHVPDDAGLLIAAPNLEQLVRAVKAFGEGIGIEELTELDARGVLEGLGLLDQVAGLDTGGPVLLALVATEPAPLLLATLSDADAWKRAVQAKELKSGLLQLAVQGERSYAATKDGILLLGEDSDVVRAALEADSRFAQRFQSCAGGLLAKDQVVVYLDASGWRPKIEAAITAVKLAIQAGAAMSASAGSTNAEFIGAFADQIGECVRQIDVLALGLRGGSEGLFVDALLTFRGGGSVCGYLRQIRPTHGDLLRGLPDDQSMLVVACEWHAPAGCTSLSTCLLKAMIGTDALREKIGSEAFDKGLAAVSAMNEGISGYNLSIAPLAGAKGILTTGSYFAADPAALVRNMCTAYEISPDFVNPMGPGSTMEITLRKERIGDMDVQAVDMVFKTQDQQVRRVLETMYGQSATLFTAPRVGDVVFTMGPTEAAKVRLEKVLAGQGGKLSEDARMLAAAKLLSPDPQAVVMVDLNEFIEFALAAAREAGAPLPPPDRDAQPAPLIAVGLYLEPEQVRAEVAVPTRPLKAAIHMLKTIDGAQGSR